MKEEDIRPKDLMIKQQEANDADVKSLQEKKESFIEVSCPACESKENKKVMEKYEFSYVECEKCETVFMNPRPTEEILNEFYKNSKNYECWNKFIFPASENARREKIFKPRVEKILEICKKHKVNKNAIMDVGAGFGTFGEEMKKTGFFNKVIAIEPTPNLAETCRKRNLETVEEVIEKVKLNEKVDVITSFEVVEHLFSPKEYIIGCKQNLSENGLIIITCPNIKGFDVNTLKELSNTIDHEHINYFNLNSLGELLTSCGFEVIEKLTPGKLDAELVRKNIIERKLDVSNQPFLKEVLINRWDELGNKFQNFLSENKLSSHMWIVAKKV